MKAFSFFLLFLCFSHSVFSQARPSYKYEISFVEPENHLAEVRLLLKNVEKGEHNFILPVWTPGYYKILDNPAHIIDFKATSEDGEEIPWSKFSKNIWTLKNDELQSLIISYRVYANRKSVAESNVSAEKAFLAATDIFMHPEGKVDAPVQLDINLPSEWNKISTGLESIDADSYYAEDFDKLYDSPLYLGNQKVINFEELGKEFTLSIATPEGLDEEKFVGDLKKIIQATTKLMKHIPFEEYAFLMMEAGGGGLEHWNSQAVFTRGSFKFESPKAYKDFMNFITHEYFHLYNVKAIRPIELGPFDYSGENYTTMLWVAEGFTVYYEYLIMRDAGLLSQQDVLDYLSSHIATIENKEGKNHMSLERSSFDVWNYFLNNNEITEETTISYYHKGPVIGLLLDIAIRHESKNKKSLDDVIRYLYTHFYQNLERGYTEEEFWEVCENMAGNSLEELRYYVESTTVPNYQKYLEYAALDLNVELLPEREKSEDAARKYQIIKIEPTTELQKEIRESLLN